MADGEQPEESELERAGGDLPPEPPSISIPWRELVGWITAALVVLWAFFLLPGIVRDLRDSAGLDDEATLEMPAMPEDPVLSEPVRDLMRRGREAEAAGHLVQARALYAAALKREKRCFSCLLRRHVVERLIMEECAEALADGARYLSESRFEEAATHYQKVIGLVPNPKANYHVIAKQGLEQARLGAKRSGRPLPE